MARKCRLEFQRGISTFEEKAWITQGNKNKMGTFPGIPGEAWYNILMIYMHFYRNKLTVGGLLLSTRLLLSAPVIVALSHVAVD